MIGVEDLKLIHIIKKEGPASLAKKPSLSTKYRGKLVRKEKQLYFLTVHPAATIYNQKLIETLKQDIKKLFEIIRELKNGKQVKIDIEFTS